MFNTKSDYALNKMDANAIVYIAADGSITRLTVQDFADEAEFRKWKSWSDERYHQVEKRDHVHANHTISMNDLPEKYAATPSPETLWEYSLKRKIDLTLLMKAKSLVTEKQFRRLWMYYAAGMTLDVIGAQEGISHQNVSKSIKAAIKRIQKSFLQGAL